MQNEKETLKERECDIGNQNRVNRESLIIFSDIDGLFGNKQYAAMALKALVVKLANDQ